MENVKVFKDCKDRYSCKFSDLTYGTFFETDWGHVCIKFDNGDKANFLDFDENGLPFHMEPSEIIYPLYASIYTSYRLTSKND